VCVCVCVFVCVLRSAHDSHPLFPGLMDHFPNRIAQREPSGLRLNSASNHVTDQSVILLREHFACVTVFYYLKTCGFSPPPSAWMYLFTRWYCLVETHMVKNEDGHLKIFLKSIMGY